MDVKSLIANTLVAGGLVAVSVAAGLVSIPAGIAVAGLVAIAAGVLLVKG